MADSPVTGGELAVSLFLMGAHEWLRVTDEQWPVSLTRDRPSREGGFGQDRAMHFMLVVA
ncbi:hypothetical protein G3I76_46575 [Streptomyces sp. SID11233]|nr:hypothetical protein [Streptomyces sp. SID11233]